jgi:PAS domain S-box-containing protein
VWRRASALAHNAEIAQLRAELAEARELVRVIQSGAIDALVTARGGDASLAIVDRDDLPYRKFFEAMDQGALTVTPEGVILFGNRRIAEITGHEHQQLVGTSVLELVTPATRSIVREALGEPSSTHRDLEARLLTLDEQERPVTFTTSHLDLDGETAVCLLFTDVSERKGFEDDLRFRSRLLDAAGEAIIVLGDESAVVYANIAAERAFGYPRSEMLGRPADEVVPSNRTPEQTAQLASALRVGGSWSGEYRVGRRDGSTFPAFVTETPLVDDAGEIIAVIVIIRDVTAQKAAEEELKASERWYRALIQNSSDIVSVAAPDGTYTYLSPSVAGVLGYPPDALVGTSRSAIVHPDDERIVRSAFVEAMVRGIPRGTPLTFRARAANGEWRYLETVFTNLMNDPVVNGIVANARDVTDARRALAALETSQALLTDAQALTHVGHWQWHVADGRVEWLAAEMFAIHGIAPDAWVGTIEAQFATLHPDDRDAVERALTAIDPDHGVDIQCRIVRPDEEVRHIRIRAQVLAHDGSAVVLGTTQDVTDPTRARIALEKMNDELRVANDEVRSSLERLRASDAQRRRLLHEIVTAQEAERRRISADIHDDSIQVIAATKMRLDLIRRKGGTKALMTQLTEFSDLLGECLTRLRTLVFRLIPPSLEQGGLPAAFEEILSPWAAESGVTFTVEGDVDDELNEDEQIILFRIGQEALANVRKHAEAAHVAITLALVDGGVLLTVADDGVGISGENPDGQPHFGVATMAERAELAGGWCRISSPGKGTLVEAWIPKVRPG